MMNNTPPACNEQFATSGGATRPKLCV